MLQHMPDYVQQVSASMELTYGVGSISGPALGALLYAQYGFVGSQVFCLFLMASSFIFTLLFVTSKVVPQESLHYKLKEEESHFHASQMASMSRLERLRDHTDYVPLPVASRLDMTARLEETLMQTLKGMF